MGWDHYGYSVERGPNWIPKQLPPLVPREFEQCYTEGWKSAQRFEREHGSILFMLETMRGTLEAARADSCDWYGDDFDPLLALVNKVISEIKENRETEETKSR